MPDQSVYGVDEVGHVQVLSDGQTCWVNGPDGACLGRFVQRRFMAHMDVHKDFEAQILTGEVCLDCRVDPTWTEFKVSMLLHHGVIIDDEHRPYLS